MQRAILLFLCAALAASAAQAEEKYQRKSGLWEIKRTSTVTRDEIRTYQLCVEQASDDVLRHLGTAARQESCTPGKVTRSGDQLTFDATCELNKGKDRATTHAVITGKFDSAYKIETKSTYDSPRLGKTESTALVEAKWTGACKPDQHPGDFIMPNGKVYNINGDKKAMLHRGHQGGQRNATPPPQQGSTPAPAPAPAPTTN